MLNVAVMAKTIFVAALFSIILELYQCAIIVQTESGRIEGQTLLNWDGGKYYSFTSIPYAKPPLKELRFKAPVPPFPWEDILNARKPAPMCPQFSYDDLVGQEDCLYLNVYTRSLNENQALPVLVYIHGGGYFVGSGSSTVYGPQFLITKDIVLVTFDYRLGYLGALSFQDQSQGVPGNAHIKDQVMALKWIRDNIQRFGGDKNLVTVFGESVGGASVHMHLLSPMSRGLVHRVIAESGCALNAWNHGVLGTGDRIAKQLGIKGESTSDIIQQLQAIPMEEFVRRTQQPGELAVPVDGPVEFAPVIELQTNEPAFLSKPLTDLFSEAPSNVPLMLGYNNNDTLIFQVMRRLYTGKAFIFDNINATIPFDIQIPNEKERLDLIASIHKTFFNTDVVTVQQTSQYGLGPWFVAGYLQSIEKHLASNHDVYFYIFSSDTRLNFFKRLHPVTASYKGASHMDELGYLFTTEYTPFFPNNGLEDKSWRATVNIWTDFARYGKPHFEWEKITDMNNISYVEINGPNLRNAHEPNPIVWNFWRNVYKRYNF